MNNELSKIFCPTYKDSFEVDRRFNDDIKTIFEQAGSNVFLNLRMFQDQKSELEKEYANYALNLCIAFLERIIYVNENEPWDSTTNKYKWRSKQLAKCLRSGLTDLGFKASNISKLIGAAEILVLNKNHVFDGNYDFGGSLEEDAALRKYHAWAKSQGVSALYELSRMEYLIPYSPVFQSLSDLSNEFKENVPIRSLEKLRQQYPKYDIDRNASFPKTNDQFKVLAPTQEQLVEQLIPLVQSIDLDMILVDTELKVKLESIHHPLMTLADITIPTQTRPT